MTDSTTDHVSQVPSQYEHVYYDVKEWRDDYGLRGETRSRTTPEQAKVVSSEIKNVPNWHTIMLDIDLPASLIESSTPGHFHLYIDKPMPWRKYRRLIRSLSKAGVIEAGFAKASISRKGTHLRPPWVTK